MKRIILSFIILTFTFLAFSSDVSDLLKAAQESYESGDLSTALQKIDSAKAIIEREKLSSSSNDYIELENWNAVKINKAKYLGKKVKVPGVYCNITAKGLVHISSISTNNTYDEELVDKLLSLKKYEMYIFYGSVQDGGSLGPKLHIEAIE